MEGEVGRVRLGDFGFSLLKRLNGRVLLVTNPLS